MNFPILAALLSVTAYMLMQIVFKRAGNTHPLALTAWVGCLLPVWVGVLALGLPSHLLVFEPSTAYFAWTGLWAFLGVGSMGLLLVLIQKLALAELAAYRKVFTVLLVGLADVLLVGEVFSPTKLAVLGLILAGSVLLTSQRKQVGPFPWVDIATVAALCAIMAVQLYAYKRALALQPDVLSHIAFAKAVFATFSLVLLALPTVRQGSGSVGLGVMLAVAGLFVVGSIAEGFALKDLPMAVVVATGLGMAGVFAVHDLARGDMPATPRSLTGITLVLLGLALLVRLG